MKGITREVKQFVSTIDQNGTTKPRLIMRKLKDLHGIKSLKTTQLSYIFNQMKETTFGRSHINLDEFSEYK
jgi:hypothetical protein